MSGDPGGMARIRQGIEGTTRKAPNIGRNVNAEPSGPDLGLLNLQLLKWNVNVDDPRVEMIVRRLAKVWPRLSVTDRAWLLCAAESIAAAGEAKTEWNPKEHARRHKELRRASVHAAKLAKEVRALFPHDPDTKIMAFVSELGAFAEGTMVATLPVAQRTTVQLAESLVRGAGLRIKGRTGQMYLELIADLAWLAGGLKTANPISERSVRRLLQPDSSSMGYKKKAARKVSFP